MDTLRYRVVFKYIGGVLLVVSGGYLLSSVVSFLTGEPYILHFLGMAAATALCGWYLRRGVPEKTIQRVEVGVVAALSFLVVSLVSALPFVYIAGLSPLDGWFESMSGVTTTGFSLLTPEALPKTMLFFRSLLQWFGGLGFMALTVTLLMVSGRPAVAILKEDVQEGKLTPRITAHVHIIFVTYLVFTLGATLALWVAGLDVLKSVCYALSGISTGGFSPESPSEYMLHRRVVSVVTLFVMLSGAVNFVIYYRIWKERVAGVSVVTILKENNQPIFLFLLVSVVFLFVAASVPEGWSIYEALFLTVSAQTTTGFYIQPPSGLPAHLMSLLVISMFVGGCMGSTAGGIKVYRAVEVVRLINNSLVSRLYTREKVLPHHRKVVEGREEPVGVFSLVLIYVIVITLATIYLMWHGYEPLASLFDVTSAVSTVGLTAGVVTEGMGWDTKVMFIGLMWAGRLEFIPVLLWLYATIIRTE